jgi:hypothetical protein
MSKQTFDEFMAAYAADGRKVLEVDATWDANGLTPFIVVRDGGGRTVVINPMTYDDHLCIDLHPFADGKDATAGVFGMTEGQQHAFPPTGTTSHRWPSTRLVAVIVGEQGTEDTEA